MADPGVCVLCGSAGQWSADDLHGKDEFFTAALLFFAPFALVIFNSVKPLDQIMTDLLGLPRTVQLSNYLNAWQELNMGRVMLNTILVTGISLALILTLSCMVAYWTVRHPTKYSRLFEKLLVCSLLIPFAAVMLSLDLSAWKMAAMA